MRLLCRHLFLNSQRADLISGQQPDTVTEVANDGPHLVRCTKTKSRTVTSVKRHECIEATRGLPPRLCQSTSYESTFGAGNARGGLAASCRRSAPRGSDDSRLLSSFFRTERQRREPIGGADHLYCSLETRPLKGAVDMTYGELAERISSNLGIHTPVALSFVQGAPRGIKAFNADVPSACTLWPSCGIRRLLRAGGKALQLPYRRNDDGFRP